MKQSNVYSQIRELFLPYWNLQVLASIKGAGVWISSRNLLCKNGDGGAEKTGDETEEETRGEEEEEEIEASENEEQLRV